MGSIIYHTILCSISWCTVVYCSVLCYTILYYTLLYYTILHYITLDYSVLYSTLLSYLYHLGLCIRRNRPSPLGVAAFAGLRPLGKTWSHRENSSLDRGTWDPSIPRGSKSSSFLVKTYLLLREYNILPKKELHASLGVSMIHTLGLEYVCHTYLGLFGCHYTTE